MPPKKKANTAVKAQPKKRVLTTDRSVLPDAETMLFDVLEHRGWDIRSGQVEMVMLYDLATADNEVTDQVVKAPVGTGKSLATAIAIVASGRHGLICTSSKALQNQYFEEELQKLADDLADIYGYKLTYAIVKGQSNYLCLAAASGKLTDDDDEEDDLFEMSSHMSSDTVDGIIDELVEVDQERLPRIETENIALDDDGALTALPSREVGKRTAARKCKVRTATWKNVASDVDGEDDYLADETNSDHELPKSPLEIIRGSECLYRSAYAKGIIADVTVISTQLLAAELRRYNVLSDFPASAKLLTGAEVIVVDESHHAPEILANSMKVEIDFHNFETLVAKDARSIGKAVELASSGSTTPDKIAKGAVDAVRKAHESIHEMFEEGEASTPNLVKCLKELQGDLENFLKKSYARFSSSSNDTARKRGTRASNYFKEEVMTTISELIEAMEAKYESEYTGKEERSYLTEVNIIERRNDPENICVTAVPINLSFFRDAVARAVLDTEGSPIEVAVQKGDANFALTGRSTVALCSGTITEMIGSRIGFNEYTPFNEVESPFDPKLSRICVPTALKLEPKEIGWADAAWDIASEAIEAAGGRTLFLSTSYTSMIGESRGKFTTKGWVDRARVDFPDYTILVQGEMDRDEILSEFKRRNGEQCIIFGVKSFSEGVDLPGQKLVQVIQDKIMFPVSGDPVVSATRKAVERRGGNPFMEVDVDIASINFAQAHGRGQRTETDMCGMLVLDRRLTNARYGPKIMSLVPRETPFTKSFNAYLDWIEYAASEEANVEDMPDFSGWKDLRPERARKVRG